MLFAAFIVYPIKDFFIALLFSYMYFRQGKKQQSQFNDLLKANDDFFENIKNDPLLDRDGSNEM
jgi:hypothetical protein